MNKHLTNSKTDKLPKKRTKREENRQKQPIIIENGHLAIKADTIKRKRTPDKKSGQRPDKRGVNFREKPTNEKDACPFFSDTFNTKTDKMKIKRTNRLKNRQKSKKADKQTFEGRIYIYIRPTKNVFEICKGKKRSNSFI